MLDFNDKERDYVAFISGMEFGSRENQSTIQMLLKFLRGEYGSDFEQQIASQIKRLVICGNSITEPTD